MKITEKIVTSVTQPQQTNVLWHNPETGELKMFGNKGWEVVGGNPGEGGSSSTDTNGYPIVTVEDNFTIEAKPNIFYNIKNNADSEVSINFVDEEIYPTGKSDRKVFFFGDPMEESMTNGGWFEMIAMTGIPEPSPCDFTIEDINFKYKSDYKLDFGGDGVDLTFYFSSMPENAGSVFLYVEGKSFGSSVDVGGLISNIIYIDDEYFYFIGNHDGINLNLYLGEAITSDVPEFKYMYNHPLFGTIYINNEKKDIDIIYGYNANTNTYTPFNITKIYNGKKVSNEVKEFVFNLNCPASIVFSHPIKWNNYNEPDLTSEGICTISILDGVGCYTFVNN